MSYLDVSFQQCAGYGWQGGPAFNTQIVAMQSGRENRNAMIAKARHQFQAPFQNISREAYRSIKQMHLVCRGMLHCFKFRDELDYQADNEVFAVGNGTQTKFQIGKTSVIDGVSYQREVYVIDGPATFTANNSPISGTVDRDRGIVTFSSAPANGAVLRWSGEFMLWVRFNQDYLPFSIDNGNGQGAHFINGSVDLIEVPPPPPPPPVP